MSEAPTRSVFSRIYEVQLLQEKGLITDKEAIMLLGLPRDADDFHRYAARAAAREATMQFAKQVAKSFFTGAGLALLATAAGEGVFHLLSHIGAPYAGVCSVLAMQFAAGSLYGRITITSQQGV